MKLNHLNLGVSDVLASASMFETYFGFSRIPGPSTDKMAFMADDAGSLIALFKSNDVSYPKIFHIGFMMETVAQVHEMHARLTDDGFEPQAIKEEHGRVTFYFKAPGGFVVEVDSFVENAPAEWRNSLSVNKA